MLIGSNRGSTWLRVAGLMGLLGLGLVTVEDRWWGGDQARREPPRVEELAERRQTVPRWSGLTTHAPCRPPEGAAAGYCRAEAPPLPPALRALPESAVAWRPERAARSLQAEALAFALIKRPGTALEKLEKAATLDPRSASIALDLSAAWWLQARSGGGRTVGFLHSLRHADRAVVLEPESPAAHFNRALALAALHLDGPAAEAFARTIELERDPAWIAEAEARLEHLEAAAARRVETGAEELHERIGDEACPRWAADPGARRWAEVRRLAEELRRLAGDEEMLDTVLAIERAGPQERRALAAAHRRFAVARRL